MVSVLRGFANMLHLAEVIGERSVTHVSLAEDARPGTRVTIKENLQTATESCR